MIHGWGIELLRTHANETVIDIIASDGRITASVLSRLAWANGVLDTIAALEADTETASAPRGVHPGEDSLRGGRTFD